MTNPAPLRRSCRSALLGLVLLALPGCGSVTPEPTTGATDAAARDTETTQPLAGDIPTASDSGPHVTVLPPVVLSAATAPTAEERAQWAKDLAAGTSFNALRVHPDAVLVSQSACDAAVVLATELRLPLAGNEALLDLKPGVPLIGQRAAAGARAPGSNNVFGFLRKVVSVAAEGDVLVITTAKARLQDAVLGAAQVAEYKPRVEHFIDLEGVDVTPFFGASTQRRKAQSRDGRSGQFGSRRSGLKLADFDESFELYGVGGDFSLEVADVSATIPIKVKGKVVNINVEGSATLVGLVNFVPTFSAAAVIEVTGSWWPPWEWVKVEVTSASVSAELEATVEAGLELEATVTPEGGDPPDDDTNDAMKDDPAKSGDEEVSLSEVSFEGPMLGPVPTTFKVELVAECGMGVYGTVNATVAAGIDLFGKAGLAYDGEVWKPINSLGFNKRYSLQVALGGGISAECSVGPQVSWLIADTAGPSLSIAASVEGKLDYASECPDPKTIGAATPPDGTFTKAVEAALKVVFGISVEFLGVELGTEKELTGKTWPLYEDIDMVPGLGICQSACTNGVKDNLETDLDCGGSPSKSKPPLCPGCGAGRKCVHHLDCAGSNSCLAGVCTAIDCKDSKMGPGELGVDCGDKCGIGCALGNACYVSADCASQNCVGGKCTEASCTNNVQDNTEPGLDCGGPCPKCLDGAACSADAECESETCLPYNPLKPDKNGFCAPPGCSLLQWKALRDGKKSSDLGETDVDCGGPCAIGPLPDNACNGGVCGLKAARCVKGKDCKKPTDCATGNCTDSGVCGVTLCFDGKKNGDETGPDCGGGCTKRCVDGQGCLVHKDCAGSSKCLEKDGVKTCGASCGNGVMDFGESDKDCGLVCPMKCKKGQTCVLQGDCVTGSSCTHVLGDGDYCMDLCANGELDPAEPEIDCGAACPTKCKVAQACGKDADCATASCGFYTNGKAGFVPGTSQISCTLPCQNGRKDPKEPDLDCGAVCGNKWCQEGKKCFTSADCVTNYCAPNGTCRMPTCLDGWTNGGETDVDCGKVCGGKKCEKGQKCGDDGDCKLGKCADGVCIGDPCADGKQQPDESDVDCGGGTEPFLCYPCKKGQKCGKNGDCKSNQCDGGLCIYEPCTDKVQSAGEADVDCGGICTALGKTCAFDRKCKKGSDCQSGYCNGHHCVASACQDKLQDAGETDVDCGGPCETHCALGKTCKAAGDCLSGACAAKSHTCVESGCLDELRSGDETDVDCGGSCAKCAVWKGCKTGTDCVSQVCNGTVCVEGTCDDGLKNGTETDADCGGTCVARCTTGKACGVAADCVSGLCSAAGLCVLTTCDDGLLSPNETGLDCGGACPTLCLAGQGCTKGEDCALGLCSEASGLCVAGSCEDGLKTGGEAGVDCGVAGKACTSAGQCPSGSCNASGYCVPLCGGVCLGAACSVQAALVQQGYVCAKGLFCSQKGNVKCVASSCDTGVVDGAESDVDCGGSCPKCANTKGCKGPEDCTSGLCSAVSKTCVADTCHDEAKSPGELDVDCGGTCGACGKGALCTVDSDCTAAFPCTESAPGGAKYCGCPVGMDRVRIKKGGVASFECAFDVPVWGVEPLTPYDTFDNGVLWVDQFMGVVYGNYRRVLDNRTGLEWLARLEQTAPASMACNDYIVDGIGGWRAPTRAELLSAVDWNSHPVHFDTKYIYMGTSGGASGGSLYTATPWHSATVGGFYRATPAMWGFDSATPIDEYGGYPCVRSTKSWPMPTGRFTVEDEGTTVLDAVTGLLWQRSTAPEPLNYSDSESYCAAKGGLWRMPNVRELASLIVLGTGPVKIDAAAFPKTPKGRFWAVSKVQFAGTNSEANDVMSVDFETADVSYVRHNKSWLASTLSPIRCVK